MANQLSDSKFKKLISGENNTLGSFKVVHSSARSLYSEFHVQYSEKKHNFVVKFPHSHFFSKKNEPKEYLRRIDKWKSIGVHPHVETCYGFFPGQAEGLVFEHIPGQSLWQWIKTQRFSLRAVLSLAIQMCHGLEYLHSQSLFHLNLSPQSIMVTPRSLAKITDVTQPLSGKGDSGTSLCARSDITGMGHILKAMLCKENFQSRQDCDAINFRDKAKKYALLLEPILAKCFFCDDNKHFKNISELRHLLNSAYHHVYDTDCPYSKLEADYRAESLNNQAVFHFLSGNFKDGLANLQQSLLKKDRLSEAVYNLIVYKLRSGQFSREKINLMIESAQCDSSVPTELGRLKSFNKKEKKADKKKPLHFPPFLFCPAPTSLLFYRKTRKTKEKKNDLANHFKALRYEACLHSLLSSWREKKFEKDAFLSSFYDNLLLKSDKQELLGVQRYALLKGHGQPAIHIAHLPGTRKIVETSGRNEIHVRNFGKGSKMTTLKTGSEHVTSLALSSDGLIIAAGTEQGSIIFWHGRSGRPLLKKRPHNGPVASLCFCHDNRFFASSGSDGKMIVRTVSTGREKIVQVCEKASVRHLAFVPGCFDIVTACDNGEIKIWQSRGKRCLHSFSAHTNPVTSLSIAPKGDFFATCGHSIKIWDRHTAQCLHKIDKPGKSVTSLLIPDDNRHLIASDMDDFIRIWDLVTAERVMLVDGRGLGIRSLSRGAQPHFFFTGQENGALLVWKLIYNLRFD